MHSKSTIPMLIFAAVVNAVIGGCAHQTTTLIDPIEDEILPEGAALVAFNHDAVSPLVFEVTERGTVYYFAYNDLLATFNVNQGQRVELNASKVQPNMITRVTVDGEAVLVRENSRALANRMYFLAVPGR